MYFIDWMLVPIPLGVGLFGILIIIYKLLSPQALSWRMAVTTCGICLAIAFLSFSVAASMVKRM